MTWERFLNSKLTTVGLVLVLGIAMIATAKLLVQKYEVDREIKDLQAQSEEIKKTNDSLALLVKYFSTSQYEEKQAREKLNLKKPGEVVIGLPQESQEDHVIASGTEISNPKKWFNYFFNHE